MTTENQNTLPAPADIAPPVPLLQSTEQSLTEAVTGFFDLVEQQANTSIAKYADVVWQNLETGKGMQSAVDARAELRDLRTRIVDKGHEAIKAPLLAVGRIADDRKKKIGDKLKAAEALVDGPIKAEEARKAAVKAEKERLERERIAGIRENIRGIQMMPTRMVGKTAAQMRELLADMTDPTQLPDMFQELAEEAALAYAQSKDAIERLIADADAREAEQLRLQQEREEARQRQAELDRQAAELRRQQEELAAQQKAAQPSPAAEAAPTQVAEKDWMNEFEANIYQAAVENQAIVTADVDLGNGDTATLTTFNLDEIATLGGASAEAMGTATPYDGPTRDEMIAAVATTFGLSFKSAEQYLVQTFGTVAEAA